MKLFIYGFVISIVSLAACNTTKSPAVIATEKSISGINWYLKKIVLSTGELQISNANAYIKLDATKNAAGGRGGCNNFGSNYNVNGQALNFKNIFSTKMFCEKHQAEENLFFKQLEIVNRFDIKDGKLLMYADSQLVLEFSK